LIINIKIDYEYHWGYAGSATPTPLAGSAGAVMHGWVGMPVPEWYIIINILMVGFGSEPFRSGSGRFWSVTSIGGRFASTGVAMDV